MAAADGPLSGLMETFRGEAPLLRLGDRALRVQEGPEAWSASLDPRKAVLGRIGFLLAILA
ncbi:MAG: hypothetical protein LC620_04120, partial [Halobacteriales archaeon]|nr:hypothetical protein [Halobacteriales archaeon]